MKKISFLPILGILILCVNPQVKGQDLSGQQIAAIENHVDSVFQKMLILAEKLDYDGLSTGVDDKYHAGFITNGKYYSDYSSLIDNIKSRAGGVIEQDITINNKKISVLTDKLALLTASGISQVTLTNGNVFDANFQWSFLYEKINGTWKVVYSHQSQAN